MSLHPAIRISGLSKAYELRSKEPHSGSLLKKFKQIFFQAGAESFVALKNISLDIEKGEVIGIIGKNGSGKSTLLQLLSGIIKPTSGTIDIDGTLTSILDIGAGFHPDLTGKENVYLNGRILGMSKERIDEKYEEILVFSGIGDFINEPVKHYSNGMYLRLAFSIFSHLDSDILLLDEVLSVGDAEFRSKCHQKINELSSQGKTLIIVSHNPTEILEYCHSCIYIENGEVKGKDLPMNIVAKYMDVVDHANIDQINLASAIKVDEYGRSVFDLSNPYTPQSELFRLISIRIHAVDKSPADLILMSDKVEVEICLEKKEDEGYLQLLTEVISMFGGLVTSDSSSFRSTETHKPQAKGIYTYKCFFPPYFFNKGTYKLGLVIIEDQQKANAQLQSFSFSIHPDEWINKQSWKDLTAPLLIHQEWTVSKV